MPQGDFANFSSTTAAVAVGFLGGYFVWVAWWAPRVVALFKARNWLTRATQPLGSAHRGAAEKVPAGLSLEHLGPGLAAATGVLDSSAWPEAFLMVVQFGLLATLVTRLSLPESGVQRLVVVRDGSVISSITGSAFFTANLTGFFGAWFQRRRYLFVSGPARGVTSTTEVTLLSLQVFPVRGEIKLSRV